MGTPGNDVICGLGGADVIAGRGGQDVISGGRGAHDTVSYQWLPRPGLRVRVPFRAFARGTEFLSGIEDVIGSSWEDDTIHGGEVRNIIRGMAGADFLVGGRGRDHLDRGTAGRGSRDREARH